jgi:hypothetical protein
MQAFPVIIFLITLISSWLAAQVGIFLHKRNPENSAREDLGRVLTYTLTLLGLIVGFSFSMAVGEYEQRVGAEETEATTIGTEYARAGLLPSADAERVRKLLADYLQQRIQFYTTDSPPRLVEIRASSARLLNDLWSAVQSAGVTDPTPIISLAVAGENDVLTSQSSTRAAWSNRIPIAGWALLEVITMFANLLFGYVALSNRAGAKRFWVLPLLVSLSLGFIADMDNPRDGFIQLIPHNLMNLAGTLQ